MQKVEEFGTSSSIHGIKYVLILNYAKTARIFWLIAIFLSLCGFFYYVHSAYYKLMFDPETVMKASDRNSFDFPAPAVTICSGLFAKDGLANLTRAVQAYIKKIKLNSTKTECEYLEANLLWCDPNSAGKILKECFDHYDISNANLVRLMFKSAHSIRNAFSGCDDGSCDKELSRVLTDYGICFTRNSLSYSSMFNTKVIHDDFACYKRMENATHEKKSHWWIETGYDYQHSDFPKRASKGMFFRLFPITLNSNKNNMCGSSSFRIYLHKPNEMVTPSHLIEYLDLGEVSALNLRNRNGMFIFYLI
jgi:Amiloride-sensitive sodium channel